MDFIMIFHRVLLIATKAYHKSIAVVLRCEKEKLPTCIFYTFFTRVDSSKLSIFTSRLKSATSPTSTSINNRLHMEKIKQPPK